MLSFRWIGRKNEDGIPVLPQLKNHNQKPSRTCAANSLPGAAIGRLDCHPEFKQFCDFLRCDVWVSLSKMDLAVPFAGEYKPHRKIVA